jgi:hypothetical protein
MEDEKRYNEGSKRLFEVKPGLRQAQAPKKSTVAELVEATFIEESLQTPS